MKLIEGLEINQNHITPLYIQIVNKIIDNIKKDNLKIGEKLPSINAFSKEYKVSRDTVERAYKELKHKGIIESRIGKGVYVKTINFDHSTKILFLTSGLTTCFLRVYTSFIRSIGSSYQTDFEIYYHNESLFSSLIDNNIEQYDYFVIMPEFEDVGYKENNLRNNLINFIKSISKEKLIVLESNSLLIRQDTFEIYEDYEIDIYKALKSKANKIRKYDKLSLIIPHSKSHPYIEIMKSGFLRFCEERSFEFKVLNKIEEERVRKSNLFIVITDTELFDLLDFISTKRLTIGEDVGIVSCNEPIFKQLLDIDVFATDLVKMGESVATMIRNIETRKTNNLSSYINWKFYVN